MCSCESLKCSTVLKWKIKTNPFIHIYVRFIDDERLTANGFDVCLKTGKCALPGSFKVLNSRGSLEICGEPVF